MLTALVATISVALLGSAAAFASASTPQPPLELPVTPGATVSGLKAATTSDSDAAIWIVAGRPGAATTAIAADSGAGAIFKGSGIFRVARDEALDMASSLRASGRLAFAEPDEPVVPTGYPDDLLSSNQWWLNEIVNPTDTTPPPVSQFSPELALIEESVDSRHPDLARARLSGALSISPEQDSHGTAIAAIAGSPGEGVGIRGVWPGMKMRLFPSGQTCSTASAAVMKAAKKKVAVINMSYALPAGSCFSHFVATEDAVQKGILPVASAGNTNLEGNAPVRPAVDPHVLTVSAVDDSSLIGDFATRNDGVDITAPGVSVFAPTVTQAPASVGSSGTIKYDWANQSGTSISAPMVAAAATWLKQARPDLDAQQIGRALTRSSTDVGALGRDPEYGEGLLNIDAALTVATPARDPMEPNDDIKWLTGALIETARFLYKPADGKEKAVTATLSRHKDPTDVYRVKIAPRSKVLITTAQYQGDIKVEVYKPKVKSISKPGKNLIVRSDQPKTKTEGVRVKNLKGKAQAIYVAITPGKRSANENFRYRLTVAK
ncbi:MAG: S8 family peptidase [Solirubrobacterales bacterium]